MATDTAPTLQTTPLSAASSPSNQHQQQPPQQQQDPPPPSPPPLPDRSFGYCNNHEWKVIPNVPPATTTTTRTTTARSSTTPGRSSTLAQPQATPQNQRRQHADRHADWPEVRQPHADGSSAKEAVNKRQAIFENKTVICALRNNHAAKAIPYTYTSFFKNGAVALEYISRDWPSPLADSPESAPNSFDSPETPNLPFCSPLSSLHPPPLAGLRGYPTNEDGLAAVPITEQGHFEVRCPLPSGCCDASLCDYSTLRWKIPQCKLFPFLERRDAVKKCFESTTFVFLGDSTIRGMMNRALDYLQLPITPPGYKGSLLVGRPTNPKYATYFQYWPYFWARNVTPEYVVEAVDEAVDRMQLTSVVDESVGRAIGVLGRRTVFVLFGIFGTGELLDAAAQRLAQRLYKVRLAKPTSTTADAGATSTAAPSQTPSPTEDAQTGRRADAYTLPAHISIVAKSKSPAYNDSWIQAALSEFPGLADAAKANNVQLFDTLTLGLPIWNQLQTNDECLCHADLQFPENSPGERVKGRVNDVWTNLLLNGICADYRT